MESGTNIKLHARKKKKPDFNQSEPEFLISCMTVIRIGQSLFVLSAAARRSIPGEAGITEWIESLNRSFPDWHIYISSRLTDSEYGAGEVLGNWRGTPKCLASEMSLHLAVSMRSFRAENVSFLVKQLLDLNAEEAQRTLDNVRRRSIQ